MARYAFLGITAIALLSAAVFAALREGKPIPSFQTTLLDGKTVVVRVVGERVSVQFKEGRNNRTLKPKVFLLDFWATWCPQCQVISKWLSQLHQKYHKKGLFILAISVDEDGRESVVPFVRQAKVPYTVALDPRAEVANRFKVEGLPTIYVVNEKGVIVRIFEGRPDSLSELERTLKAAGL